MRSREVLELLESVPDTDAEEPAVGKGDESLDRLESAPEGIAPGIKEACDPLYPYLLNRITGMNIATDAMEPATSGMVQPKT